MNEFKPETNQGFESMEEKQANSPAIAVLGNIQTIGGISKLISGTIQSPNYLRGVRGWCLYANGNIDFPGI